MSTNVDDNSGQPTGKKKKVLGCLGIIILAIILFAGCSALMSGGSETDASTQETEISAPVETPVPEPVEEATVPEEPSPAPLAEEDPALKDQLYLNAVRLEGSNMLKNSSDAALIEAGKETCNVLDSGVTLDTLAYQLLSDPSVEVSPEDIGILIGGGVAVYCPQHQGQVDQFVQTYG